MTLSQRLCWLLLLLPTTRNAVTGAPQRLRRTLAGNQSATATTTPYYTLTSTELGRPNPDAAIGNPLKGLVPCPQYNRPPYSSNVPHALEFYYIGLKQVMVDNPDVVGATAAFNWTVVENILAGAASRSTHAILRFYVVYPGRDLEVPLYLLKQPGGIVLRNYTEDGYINNQSPYFGDAPLRRALELFVRNLARKYDGHRRIGFIQAGLLGFWGEWHSMGKGFLPDNVTAEAETWFIQSFRHTQIQFRYPSPAIRDASAAGPFGLHDDSFAYETLDGAANGGYHRSWYFWPRVMKQNMTSFWKRGAMGGETRVEIAHEVFEPTYDAGTFRRQPFLLAVNTTHMTYSLQHSVYHQGGFVGAELANARSTHARMGYNFHVSTVAVQTSAGGSNLVRVDVTLTQVGVAPFYYDLNLTLQCSGLSKQSLRGAETLIETGATKVFVFERIPATSQCLRALSLSLESSYSLPGRPIKFAQGNGNLVFRLPLPNNATHSPTLAPSRQPTRAPTSFAPTLPESLATRLTLMDADTDVAIGRLTNGMMLNLTVVSRVNVRADPSPTFRTRSVEFKYDGVRIRIDNGEPYAFQRNTGLDYSAWTPVPGVHTIVATPYTGADATGLPGPSAQITFTVVGLPKVPTSMPVPISTRAPVVPLPRSSAPVVKTPVAAPRAPMDPPRTKLTLINADTDLDIGTLTNGTTINLYHYPSLNVRADPPSNFIARSVQFKHNGVNGRIDNGEPYAFQRNTGSNYSSWTPTLGVHTISATPFSGPDANGTATTPGIATFTVVYIPPPSATKTPFPAPVQARTLAPQVKLPTSSKLTLINADSDLDIGPLMTGMTINLYQYPSLNVRADPPSSFIARSVQFKYNGVAGRIDNGEPYAFQRNTGTNYSSWTPTVGNHTITATPFTGPDANGTAGPIGSATFTVVYIAPPMATKAPIPAPLSSPTRTPNSQAPVRSPMSQAPVKQVHPVLSTLLTLINADTDIDIGPLATGSTINLHQFPSLNVRADPPPSFSTRSVQFHYDGVVRRIDNGAPYAFQRNIGSNYFSWTPTLGNHSISATPFSGPDTNGTAGPAAHVTFMVVNVTLTTSKNSTLVPINTTSPLALPVAAPPAQAPRSRALVSPTAVAPSNGHAQSLPTPKPISHVPVSAPKTHSI